MIDLSGIEFTKDETHRRLLKQAYDLAWEDSADPHTKTAALVVRDGNIISKGVNHLPPGVEKRPERLERPLKYSYLTHAERAALYSAAKAGAKTDGAAMYTPWLACTDCAMAIIEGGIREVVGHRAMVDRTTGKWSGSIGIALGMLREAGVRIVLYDGEIGEGTRALFGGEEWAP